MLKTFTVFCTNQCILNNYISLQLTKHQLHFGYLLHVWGAQRRVLIGRSIKQFTVPTKNDKHSSCKHNSILNLPQNESKTSPSVISKNTELSLCASPPNEKLNFLQRGYLTPNELLLFCHPEGIKPPPIEDTYMDGKPPVCGIDKFKWVWRGKEWTYKFTVIENTKRSNLMPSNASHTIAFFPSISPTSSKEEMRQCARMLANKGHQCLLIELPGFHEDTHINNRTINCLKCTHDGIYTLDNSLTIGNDRIPSLDNITRNNQLLPSIIRLALIFYKNRCSHYLKTIQLFKHTYSSPTWYNIMTQYFSTCFSQLHSIAQKMTNYCNYTSRTNNRLQEDCIAAPMQPSYVMTEENYSSIPYAAIHRSFFRQYLRFLLLYWGATPLTLIPIGQSNSLLLRGLDDLIELGKKTACYDIELLATSFKHNEWKYTTDELPDIKDGNSLLISNVLSLHKYITKQVACSIIRDAVVADLIRLNIVNLISVSPYWKSPLRTYFDEMKSSELFTHNMEQYLMKLCWQLFTGSHILGKYFRTAILHVDTIKKYLTPRFERQITQYNIYHHLQAAFRHIPIQLTLAWFTGWLEPCKSNDEFEQLFYHCCVNHHPTFNIVPKNKPTLVSLRKDSYRIPYTLLLIGRASNDMVFNEFNLLAQYCYRLDKDDHQIPHPVPTHTVSDFNRKELNKNNTIMTTLLPTYINTTPYYFNNVPLPTAYNETDDWNYHRDYEPIIYKKKKRFFLYIFVEKLRQQFFPDPKYKRDLMLQKLVPGVQKEQKHQLFVPRCLPVKGALLCIEEFPKFSAECIDQFIHSHTIDFKQIEEYSIQHPLKKKHFVNKHSTLKEQDIF